MIEHIVMFSGGAGSFETWRRVTAKHGTGPNVVALLADTRSEADDWHAFVEACHRHIGGELVVLTHGLDLWELAQQQRMIPNTRVDFCSRILKREPLRRWVEENADPATATIYLGFDWTEEHRLERARGPWEPWTIAAPLCEPPFLSKGDIIGRIDQAGIPMPAAYTTGMPHNNCLKYGCVKGGQAYWKRILDHHPEVYARSERAENEVRVSLGKDVAILRDRRGGTTKPLTLADFRARFEADELALFDKEDFGSCSCMTEEGE